MKRPSQLLTSLSIIFLSSLLIGACSLAEEVTPPPNYTPLPAATSQASTDSTGLFPLVQPDAANGAAIFAEKCAPCHGDTGQGNGSKASSLPNPPTALSSPDIARQAVPAQWYTAVTQGKMDQYMPPFSSLTDSQRWDVVSYAYSLSLPAQEISQGAGLYTEKCANCHGASGKGDGPDAASLSPAPPDFTQQQYAAQKSSQDFYQAISQGISPAMPAYNDKLSDQQRWLLADYVRSLSFGSAENLASAQSTPASGISSSSTPVAKVTPGTSEAPSASTTITATQTVSNPIGTISGQVTNGSSGQVPGDLTISLHGFDNMQLVITDTTTIKPDGTYEFQNIQLAPGRIFMVSTDYQNTTYSSDIATIAAGTKKVNLDLPIFDTSTDQSTLSADRMHIFFDTSQPGKVQVAELYIVSNSGNKTVISSDPSGSVMKFSVPAGATNLQFQDGSLGGRYLEIPGGFADTMPVHPGQGNYQVLAYFDMPFNGKLDLSQPILFPVNAVVVLLPENGSSVQSSQLTDGGSRNVQGANYHLYNGGRIEAGQTLKLTYTEGSGASSFISRFTQGSSTSSVIIGAGVLGVVLIALGLVLYRRSLKAEGTEAEDDGEGDAGSVPLPQTQESLMDAIIALDDQYKEGRLPEEAYQARRSELKEKLRRVENGE